jgi:hypothetical protein
MSGHERLSSIVSGILEFGNIIRVDQKDWQVVALSFEPPGKIRPTWELAIRAACELCPWLTDDDASEGDWSMNLFTTEGLWAFPDSKDEISGSGTKGDET